MNVFIWSRLYLSKYTHGEKLRSTSVNASVDLIKTKISLYFFRTFSINQNLYHLRLHGRENDEDLAIPGMDIGHLG